MAVGDAIPWEAFGVGDAAPWNDYGHLVDVKLDLLASDRVRLTAQKKRIESMLKDLDAQIGAALSVADVKSVLCVGHLVTVVDFPGRKSTDQAKLKVELVQRGVPADVVRECVDAATKIGNPYTVVRFTEVK